MTHLLSLCATGCLMFAATNTDDLVLLVAFFAHPEFETRQVVLGQFAGIAVLVIVALAGSGAASLASPARVGLLGLLPIGLGLWRLWRLRRPTPEDAWAAPDPGRHTRRVLLVAVATISDGGDNLAAYVPYFAAQDRTDLVVTIAIFAALTAAWCLAARLAVRHRATRTLLRRYGRAALPWVMIGLGIVILVRTGALGGLA